MHPDTEAQTDTGYLGLQKIHGKTTMPTKRSKKNPLTKEDKARNRAISKSRVQAENVIACVKRFKILSEKYRNRMRRFRLRFSLIAAFYNRVLNLCQ